MNEQPEQLSEGSPHASPPETPETVSRRGFMKSLMATAGMSGLALTASDSSAQAEEEKSDKAEKVKALWAPAKPAFATKNEKFSPTVEIEKDGKIVLANRGMLLSKGEFPKGATIRFKWLWKSEEPQLYSDHLAIALRTNGDRKEKWSFEIDDGFVVRLNPHREGAVTIQRYQKGQDDFEISRKAGVDLKEGNTYDIEISDLGSSIVVKVDGKEVLRQQVDPKDCDGRNVAIYNREPVSGVRKVSTMDNLTIKETGEK